MKIVIVGAAIDCGIILDLFQAEDAQKQSKLERFQVVFDGRFNELGLSAPTDRTQPVLQNNANLLPPQNNVPVVEPVPLRRIQALKMAHPKMSALSFDFLLRELDLDPASRPRSSSSSSSSSDIVDIASPTKRKKKGKPDNLLFTGVLYITEAQLAGPVSGITQKILALVQKCRGVASSEEEGATSENGLSSVQNMFVLIENSTRYLDAVFGVQCFCVVQSVQVLVLSTARHCVRALEYLLDNSKEITSNVKPSFAAALKGTAVDGGSAKKKKAKKTPQFDSECGVQDENQNHDSHGAVDSRHGGDKADDVWNSLQPFDPLDTANHCSSSSSSSSSSGSSGLDDCLINSSAIIPGIIIKNAAKVLRAFPTMQQLANADVFSLTEVVGKVKGAQIRTFFDPVSSSIMK